MTDIYRGGQQCFVYLGEGTGHQGDAESLLRWSRVYLDEATMAANGDLALKIIEQARSVLDGGARFYPTPSQTSSKSAHSKKSSIRRQQRRNDDLTPRRSQPWHRCIDSVLAQRYWHRGWVVQELLLSRRVTCLIGDEEIPWETIRSLAFDIPIMRSSEANSAARRKIRIGKAVGQSEWMNHVRSSESHLEAESEAESANNLRAFNRFMVLLETCNGQNLVSLLQSARMLRTSDPRDKIFAMLNIACDASEYPKADYALNKEQVYRLYAECMIRKGHGIPILAASPVVGGLVSPDWPTWAPRWNEAASEFSWEASTTFSAGGFEQAGLRCNGQTTRVSAYMYDSIEFSSAALNLGSDRLYPEMAQFVDGLVKELESQCSASQAWYCDPEHSRSRMLRSIAHLLLCDPVNHTGAIFLQESEASASLRDRIERNWDSFNLLAHDVYRNGTKTTPGAPTIDELLVALTPKFFVNSFDTRLDVYDTEDGSTGDGLTMDSVALDLITKRTEGHLRRFFRKHLKHRGMPYLNFLVGKDRSSMCVVTLRSHRPATTYDERDYKYVMGLAPAACRPGDKVAIIKGARAPFILRKRASGEYWNLGQAYIRGVMMGKVANVRNEDDFRHINIV